MSLDRTFAAAMSGLGPFEPSPHLALAVSGGADSRALALLAQEWAAHHNAHVTALVVDHGLRAASTQEARETVAWLAQRDIPAELLTVQVADGNRQSRARAARYAAMGEWCRHKGVVHLLLGHHNDDQMETVLHRLVRGSGVEGLSAMQACSYRPHMRLVRPLLGQTKTALRDFLQACGEPWIEDSSNADMQYTRTRLRRLTPELRAEGLSEARLLETVHHLQAARDYLRQDAAAWLARWAGLQDAGFGWLTASAWRDAATELQRQVLHSLLVTVRGGAKAPRGEEVMRLMAALRGPQATAATLHGCRILPHAASDRFYILRETGHALSLSLAQKGAFRWDDRFAGEVTCASPPLRLQLLEAEGIAQLRAAGHRLPSGLPSIVLHSLVSVWRVDHCIAVPHIGYGETLESLGLSLRFAPVKALC